MNFHLHATDDEHGTSQTVIHVANACYPSKDCQPPDRLGYKEGKTVVYDLDNYDIIHVLCIYCYYTSD